MRAVVVALGKMGLPVAVHIARAGHDVVGCDVDASAVAAVNAGMSPFPGESGLDEAIAELVEVGRLRATTDTTAAVAEAPDLVVAVPPLYVDEHARPDWRNLDAVSGAIARGLQVGTVVSLETTVPVGTTRWRFALSLEAQSDRRVGVDFDVVFSPERVSTGRVFRDLDTYPKLVGGLHPEGERRGVALYEQFVSAEVRAMGSAEAAELTKLAETTYRDLNIAFANELAAYADRLALDVQQVIDAANSQPYSHIHRPGVAVGGHCIPVYPHFLLAGDPASRLPRVAREVNESMPAYAVGMLAKRLGSLEGRTILILGVAYRGGVKETAFSGAAALRDELRGRGARPVASDPLYSAEELEAAGYEPWRSGEQADGAIVQADHEQYRALDLALLGGAELVVDGRGVLDGAALAAAGVRVLRIGSPSD